MPQHISTQRVGAPADDTDVANKKYVDKKSPHGKIGRQIQSFCFLYNTTTKKQFGSVFANYTSPVNDDVLMAFPFTVTVEELILKPITNSLVDRMDFVIKKNGSEISSSLMIIQPGDVSPIKNIINEQFSVQDTISFSLVAGGIGEIVVQGYMTYQESVSDDINAETT